jgi:sterol 14-demethylase
MFFILWIILAFAFCLVLAKLLIPQPIPGIPIMGGPSTAIQFGKNPAALLREAHKKFGKVFTVDMYLLRMTISTDPEDVTKFYRATESDLTIKSTKRFVEAVIGSEPFGDDGPQAHKYVAEGFLKHDRLQYYFDTVRSEVTKQWENLAAKESFDLFPEISRIIVLINTLCFLGETTYNQYGEEFARSYYDIETNAFKPVSLIAPWLPTSTNRLVKYSRQKMRNIIAAEVSKRLGNPADHKNNMDFFQLTINMAQQEGFPTEKYPDFFSSAFVAVMFAAHTNLAGTLAWSLAHIADNAKYQDQARNEVESALDSNHDFNLGSLQKLAFSDSIMKEVVRNYGVLFITRGVITPIEFGGTKVPAGEIIAVSPYLTHHDPAVYEDPDTFKPERFSGNAIAKHIENKTYTQFGYGTHRCMGERFANIVMKVAWMELLTKYRVELLTPMTPPDFSRAIGVPFCTGSIRCRLTKIKATQS